MAMEQAGEARARKVSRYNLEPTPSSLTLVREFIKTTLDPFKPIKPYIPDIVCATHEAAKNAVEHNPDCHAPVEVVCRVLDDSVVVEVSDKGNGFRSGKLPPPPPDPEAVAGRGIYIICTLMDEVEALSGEGGTRIKMLKRFAPDPC
jgi:anti-sigma regulatory factor (Ser/Thr protein kinase)